MGELEENGGEEGAEEEEEEEEEGEEGTMDGTTMAGRRHRCSALGHGADRDPALSLS